MIMTSVSGEGRFEHESAGRTASSKRPSVVMRQLTPCALCIRNLAQNCGTFRTGGGRNVGRLTMPRLKCEDCECHRLFCFSGQTKLVREANLQIEFRNLVSQYGQQGRIFGSPARDNYLFERTSLGQDKLPDSVSD